MYSRSLAAIRQDFETSGNGTRTVAQRAALLDEVVRRLWTEEIAAEPKWASAIAVIAIGGYGRSQLFPCSDVDLLFCSDKALDGDAKQAIRHLSQTLWDCGLRASLATRTVSECERCSPENPEFSLSLLDRRLIVGSAVIYEKLAQRLHSKLMTRDAKSLRGELLSLTKERHAKYGYTLFHLEPNVKDCPGGIRDANVCGWLGALHTSPEAAPDQEFAAATSFLFALRCFLHYRHDRDDNTLDWQAQDAAAEQRIGLAKNAGGSSDAASWMRSYFRHARIIDRALHRAFEANNLVFSSIAEVRRPKLSSTNGFRLSDGQITFDAPALIDPAADPDSVLGAFVGVAKTGARLSTDSEERITFALPLLASHLDEWPSLWDKLASILVEPRAGTALRSMHAIGLLELLLPEFHGIDALVIRDAYHRYTVDEHTFVLIDVLHDLEAAPAAGVPEWRLKFGAMTRELHHRAALYLAALLHDTGKGRASDSHSAESACIAAAVLARLDVDRYDAELVMRLIETHLEMSVALRRDIFDAETVRVFAAKVQTHESLRMLTVFTYADIQAVHPDALTPWKAENLWRLSMSAANQLDRNVDEERVHTRAQDEHVARVLEQLPMQKAEAEIFLEGFPERYLRTRSKDAIVQHFVMTTRFAEEPFQIAFSYGAAMSEITLVTRDQPRLFSSMAGALAAKGMNVVSAEAFANASGVVVDTFRFTDSYRTLELNESERESFVSSVRSLVTGKTSIEALLKGRRSKRRRAPLLVVETNVSFDNTASSHSTLLQVVAQDVPGLLRAISGTLSDADCNVEVALIDTEGETAIDVFYLTLRGKQLEQGTQNHLSETLRSAIEANATV